MFGFFQIFPKPAPRRRKAVFDWGEGEKLQDEQLVNRITIVLPITKQ